MVNHPRNNRARHRSNRSLIRDRDRALVNKEKTNEKDGSDDVKEVIPVEVKKEDQPVKKKEDEKSKEVNETQKSLRDSTRKEITPKGKVKEEKQDKKDSSSSKEQNLLKKNEPDVSNLKSKEVTKSDEREDRIKMRESLKAADALASSVKVESKQEKDVTKGRQKDKDSAPKEKESEEKEILQKGNKVNKKDTKEVKGKQEEKEDKLINRSDREVPNRTGKKIVITNDNETSVNNQNASNSSSNSGSVLYNVRIKKRSIFSKVTGTKKCKKQVVDKPELNKVKKVLGLNTTRQKRSLKDRFKAMVKKITLKGGSNNCNDNNVINCKEAKNSKENANISLSSPSNPSSRPTSSNVLSNPTSKTPAIAPCPSPTQPSQQPQQNKILPPAKEEKKRVTSSQVHKLNSDTNKQDDLDSGCDKNEDVCEKSKPLLDDNDVKIVQTNDNNSDDKGKEEEGDMKDTSVHQQEPSRNSSNVDIEDVDDHSQSAPVVQAATSLKAKSLDTSNTPLTTDSVVAPKNIQLTRSKSKEDAPGKIKRNEYQVPDPKKPAATPSSAASTSSVSSTSSTTLPPILQAQTSCTSETEKKRGRKRKDDEKGASSEEVLDQLPSYKSVSAGDKLKVYYGPTHESKVTYEAKVLSIKEEGSEILYLVHYTGWNTRYDEWIKRSRIADNLSWTPGRVKRSRLQHQQQSQQLEKSAYDNLLCVQLPSKQPVCNSTKRGTRATDVSNGSSCGSNNTTVATGGISPVMSTASTTSTMTAGIVRRSTTPSSNRTPHATRTYTRTTKQRTRRISGQHPDSSESESAEYDSESDVEVSTLSGQKRNDKISCSGDEKDENCDNTRSKRRISALQLPSNDDKGKEHVIAGAKRKLLIPSSTSEDEREAKKPVDKLQDDNKIQFERRAFTRSSVEKEIKNFDEHSSNTGSNSERLRSRKLRSDRSNRILSESEDEKEDPQEQTVKKDLRRTLSDKKRSDDNLKLKMVENKKDSSVDEGNDGDDDDEDDDSPVKLNIQMKESGNNASIKSNQIKIEDSEDCQLLGSKGRIDKRKSDSLCKASESEVFEKEKVDITKEEDSLPRSDRLRNRFEKKKALFETKTSTSIVPVNDDNSSDEVIDVKTLRTDLSKPLSEQKSTINLDDEVEEEIDVKQEIKAESDSSEILSTISNSDNKRKLKTDKRKYGVSSFDNKINIETLSKEDVPQEGERRRSRRLPMRKDEVKCIISKEEPDDEQPKGRDFDLIQIRSELKGIEKAVKLSSEPSNKSDVGQDFETKEVGVCNSSTGSSNINNEVMEVKIKVEEEFSAKEIDLLADDIYEFKEPEPFEFEVRQKCSDEKGTKLQRRPFGRICDDLSKTAPPIRRKIIKPKLEVQSPPEGKKRFRSFTKKKEESIICSEPKMDDNKSSTVTSMPVVSPPTEGFGAPSVTTSVSAPATPGVSLVKSYKNCETAPCLSPKQLHLFEDIPEKQLKDESVSLSEKQSISHEVAKLEKRYSDISEQTESDSEDRLVISEMEDVEAESEKVIDIPAIKEKEEIQSVLQFPVTMTPVSVAASPAVPVPAIVPRSTELFSRTLSSSPPISNLHEQHTVAKDTISFMDDMSVTKGLHEKVEIKKEDAEEIKEAVVEDEEEELEDDAISAAIQRVILQSMTDDDESNDIDLRQPPLDSPAKTSSSLHPSPITQSVVPSPQLVHSVSQFCQSPTRKEGSRRRKTSKTTLSKEFIDESDSDSDDSSSITKIKPTPSFNRTSIMQLNINPLKEQLTDLKKQEDIILSPPLIVAPIINVPQSCFNFKPDDKLQKSNVCYQVSPIPSVVSIAALSIPAKESIAIHNKATIVVPASDKVSFENIPNVDNIKNSNEKVCEKEMLSNVMKSFEEKDAVTTVNKDSVGSTGIKENFHDTNDVSVNEGCDETLVLPSESEVGNSNDKKSEVDVSCTSLTSVDQEPELIQSKNTEGEEESKIEKIEEDVMEQEEKEEKEKVDIKSEPGVVEGESVLQEEVSEVKVKENSGCEDEKNSKGCDDKDEIPAEGDCEESGEDGNLGDEGKEKDEEQQLPTEKSDPEEEESALEGNQPETKEEEECVQSLLCEETIPGSPAPLITKDKEQEAVDNVITASPPNTAAELPFASAPGSSLHTDVPAYTKPVIAPQPIQPPVQPPPEAAPVMDNTPPTTPESSLSPISNSPRGERSGSSPGLDNDSSKSHRDSSEVDMDSFPDNNKMGNYSEEDTVCNMNLSSSTILKKQTSNNRLEADSSPCKKRRRSRKRSEDASKRVKLARRSPRNPAGSDSDDTSENSLAGSSLDLPSSRSPKPSKYNFYIQLDPELDGAQRIAVLQQKLQELRKTYMSLKTELACIDRRRKKLRRREREEKSSKQEVPCS